MRLPHLKSEPRGASAVEFALVLPLLVLLLMGILDWGYYFFAEQVVVNAAREGARAGSMQPTDDGLAHSEASAAATDFITRGKLNPAKAAVTVTVNPGSVSVAVQYPTGSITGLTTLVLPTAARATAEMRR